MKTRITLMSLGLCFFGVLCFAADDVQMGTWKLNEAKSKISAGAPKNSTVVYAADGDNIKVTVDGTISAVAGIGYEGYTGDGGSANDPGNRAQNTFEWLGKLLRAKRLPCGGRQAVGARTGLPLRPD